MKDLLYRLRERLRPILTKRNQRIYFVVTILFAALATYDAANNLFIKPVSIAVYVCAALCFFSSLPLWVRALFLLFTTLFASAKTKSKYIELYVKDYRLRTILGALPGLGLSFIFGISNMIIAIISHSAWHGSLAAYYLLMCAMRFSFALYAKGLYVEKRVPSALRELRIYKSCGVMLSVTSLALMGAVILLVHGDGGKEYPGVLVYVMALYAFCKLPMSIVNVIRAKKEDSPLLITLRNIGNAEALVAMLSLQTALFAQFGQDSGSFIPIMNAVTGATCCLSVLILGIYMLSDGKRRRRRCQEQTETA